MGSRLIRHERHGRGKRAIIRIPDEALEEYRLACTVGAEEPRKTPPPAPKPRRGGASDLRLKHLGQ